MLAEDAVLIADSSVHERLRSVGALVSRPSGCGGWVQPDMRLDTVWSLVFEENIFRSTGPRPNWNKRTVDIEIQSQ